MAYPAGRHYERRISTELLDRSGTSYGYYFSQWIPTDLRGRKCDNRDPIGTGWKPISRRDRANSIQIGHPINMGPSSRNVVDGRSCRKCNNNIHSNTYFVQIRNSKSRTFLQLSKGNASPGWS